jgi:Ketopantoate hydroxymethyltransferase
MTRKKPTIADLRALKGKGQLTMLRIFTIEEAEAAEQAGIDIVSLPPELLTHPRFREVAPSLFSMTGMTHLEYGTRDDYRRFAVRMLEAGGDAVYCSGGLDTVRFLAEDHIPVVGHVGLVPSRATWTGGFKAVGKTAQGALALFDECKAYEAAGAFAVEIEVVPVEVATEISKRTKCSCGPWVRGPGAMRNIFLRKIFSAPIAVICHDTQRSIEISQPNLTSYKKSGSPPSLNIVLTSSQVLIRKKTTSFECRQQNCWLLVRASIRTIPQRSNSRAVVDWTAWLR